MKLLVQMSFDITFQCKKFRLLLHIKSQNRSGQTLKLACHKYITQCNIVYNILYKENNFVEHSCGELSSYQTFQYY